MSGYLFAGNGPTPGDGRCHCRHNGSLVAGLRLTLWWKQAWQWRDKLGTTHCGAMHRPGWRPGSAGRRWHQWLHSWLACWDIEATSVPDQRQSNEATLGAGRWGPSLSLAARPWLMEAEVVATTRITTLVYLCGMENGGLPGLTHKPSLHPQWLDQPSSPFAKEKCCRKQDRHTATGPSPGST